MKKALVAIKILISVSLIAWLLSRADLSQIWNTIKQAEPELLIFAFIQFYIGYWITAKRWQSLLAALDVPVKTFTLVKSFSIAMFFNNFLPSTIGGDAYRMYDSYRLGAGKSRAIAVIFIDRIIGLSALLLLALLASLLAGEIAAKIPLLRLFLVTAVAGILVLSWIVFGSGGAVLLKLTSGKHAILRIANRIMEKLYSGFHLFQGRSDVMFKAVGLSLILQINVVINAFIITKALHIDVPTSALFIIIPLAYLIMTLPISINGIGLRESVFVFFFGLYGVAQEQALAFAFIAFAMILAQGVVGGIVFMLRQRGETDHKSFKTSMEEQD
jgi:uncharacterized protein (TIRG00374 family)